MTVNKRHIYYVSGFDPRGAAYYRRFYQAEAEKQTAVGGLPIQVGARKRVTAFVSSWQVDSRVDDQTVSTTYEYLQWDDIVRAHWNRNEITVLWNYLKAAWIYFQTGTLKRVLHASWPPFVTSLFPLAILLMVMGLAGTVAAAVWQWVPRLLTGGIVSLSPGWQDVIRWPIAIAGFVGVIQAGRALEKRMNSYWLLRIYAFSAQQGLGLLPDLEARLDQFADHIVRQSYSDHDADADPGSVAAGTAPDEILLIGHSTGTIMASSVLGRVLAQRPDLKISLLTLGQCLPIVSMLPTAQRYRDDLGRINQAVQVDWIDYTAPSDGACFALVDPIQVSGLTQIDPQQPKPKLLSPRFARLFSATTYAKMKRDWYRNHFQYIMASEVAGEYDYFAITAGSSTLRERHQAQQSVQQYQRPGPFK